MSLGNLRSTSGLVIRWYLTTDSDMAYTIFRGIEPPRLDRLSGKMRWYGSNNCVMVLTSCGSPDMFAQVFGVPMDSMECREIEPQSIRFLDRKCDRVEVPRNWPVMSESVSGNSLRPQKGLSVNADLSSYVRAGDVPAGRWFMMFDNELGMEVLANMIDDCVCVQFIEGKSLMCDLIEDQPCRLLPANEVFLSKWIRGN